MTLQLTQPLPPQPHEFVTLEGPYNNKTVYRIINGTAYHVSTDLGLVAILEQLRHDRTKVRFFFGDVLTGRDWCEENDTIGHIGRSTGRIKIPLLIKTSRSTGGGGLLDNSIVRMTVAHSEVYRHPNYYTPTMRIVRISKDESLPLEYTHGVDRTKPGEWERIANFKSQQQAERFVAFIKGERDSK